MVGELIDVIKLIIEIYKGNVPLNQVYTVIIIIVAVALVDSIIEIIKAHGSKNYFKIIAESFLYSFIGFTLYLGIYLFILRLISSHESFNDSTNIWISIISYISFISLFFFFYLCKKTSSIALKGSIIVGYNILTILLMYAMKQLVAPQMELPVSIYVLTTIFNTIISSFFTIFGTTSIESKAEK